NSGIIMMIAGSDAATVKEFLDCGVAVYAKGGTGLEGYVGIAQDLTKTGKAAYLELGAKIGFVAPTAANDIDPTEFVEVTDKMNDDIFEALKAIPVDAINYVEAEG
ncbi:MAG: hypothetical protein K5765_01060, partial [Clostridia bacterium]|nr:hypothetical protein [Clostridia bacterium]